MTVEKIDKAFVSADFDRCTQALVIAPSAHIHEARPLQAEPSPISERALEQHGVLVRRLQAQGITITPLAVQGCAENFVAGDLAVIVAGGAVLLRPSDLNRRAEVAAVELCLREIGIPVVGRIEAPGLLDGADILIDGAAAFIGVPSGVGPYVHRSNLIGRSQFAALTGLQVIEVAVAARIPRLRSVATLVDAKTVVLAPSVVDAAAFAGYDCVAVPSGEEYAAGLFVFGRRKVLANLRFREAPAVLRKAKIAVESIDLGEFGKLGYAPSCLVVSLRRR